MKYLILFFLLAGCTLRQDAPNTETVNAKEIQTPERVYYSKEAGADTDIINESGHMVVVEYNSTNNFLLKTDTTGVHFSTECMVCEQIMPYKDHLVFANQMEMFPDKASFNQQELNFSDTAKAVKTIGSYGRSGIVRFPFSEGNGTIKHLKQSCNDADLKEVTLHYTTGDLKIKNVLNASFFEYDLDKDGKLEQFIMGTRNCSQELAIIRIL